MKIIDKLWTSNVGDERTSKQRHACANIIIRLIKKFTPNLRLGLKWLRQIFGAFKISMLDFIQFWYVNTFICKSHYLVVLDGSMSKAILLWIICLFYCIYPISNVIILSELACKEYQHCVLIQPSSSFVIMCGTVDCRHVNSSVRLYILIQNNFSVTARIFSK